jgi:Flp pilus assembly protein TadD
MAVRLLEEGARGEARARLVGLTGAGPVEVAARAGLLLGRLLRRDGDREAAVRVLRGALRRKPGWGFLWRELAGVLVEAGHWRAAASCLAEARRLFPGDPLLLCEQVRLLAATGRPLAAVAAARSLVQACPQWAGAAALARRCERLADAWPQGRTRSLQAGGPSPSAGRA